MKCTQCNLTADITTESGSYGYCSDCYESIDHDSRNVHTSGAVKTKPHIHCGVCDVHPKHGNCLRCWTFQQSGEY